MPVRAGARRRRARRAAADAAAPPRPRARVLGQPRARASTLRRGARAAPRARGRRDAGEFAVETDLRDRRATAATSPSAASSACTPPTASPSASAPRSRCAAGWARARRRIVAGLVAADHLFELDADLLAHATELEGHPDNVAAALLGGFVRLRRRPGDALRRPRPGSRPCSVVPRARPCARSARARRCPAEVPMADAVFNVAHGGAADARPGARRPRSRRARPARPPAPAPARRTCSRARWSSCRRARASWGRSARRSPAPARPCSSGAATSRPGRSSRRCASATEGWATVRAPFEPQGADVRALVGRRGRVRRCERTVYI